MIRSFICGRGSASHKAHRVVIVSLPIRHGKVAVLSLSRSSMDRGHGRVDLFTEVNES
jgi:hypothetical protein